VLAVAHAYDPTYEATVATVIPFVFIAIVVDLRLPKRSATPLAAGILLSIVIVLLAWELLCLNALSLHRELRSDESRLVAGAVLFSGTIVLYRVSEPLVKTTITHPVGKWMVGLFASVFALLVVLHAFVLSGDKAVVAFASWVLIFGVIVPGLVGIARVGARPKAPQRTRTRNTLRRTTRAKALVPRLRRRPPVAQPGRRHGQRRGEIAYVGRRQRLARVSDAE